MTTNTVSTAQSEEILSEIMNMANKIPCSMCVKTFLNPSQLAKHMLTHTDEEPHKCEQCNKSFSLAKDLKKHLLTHTGEEPHKCAQCEKAFSEHR